jgi:hypothetical protein
MISYTLTLTVQDETDSEAESLSKKNEEAKSKAPSATGTKPSSPSANALEPNKSSTPGLSPGPSAPNKKQKNEKDRTTPQKSRHNKKESLTSTGGITPSKAPSSRRVSPKPSSRQSSPKPVGKGSRAGSPLAQIPVSGGDPATPSSATPMTGLEGLGDSTSGPGTSSRPSLIVRLQISPAGRKRLREEESSQSTVKRIKFNLKSGGKALSPSPPPEDHSPALSRGPSAAPSPAATSSPEDYLITEEEIVALIRGERLTTKQLLAKLKGKLKRNENNKAIVGGVLKKRCRIVEGFLVLKD